MCGLFLVIVSFESFPLIAHFNWKSIAGFRPIGSSKESLYAQHARDENQNLQYQLIGEDRTGSGLEKFGKLGKPGTEIVPFLTYGQRNLTVGFGLCPIESVYRPI